MAKILVVDDDELSRLNISRFLADDGHSVEEAADGAAALDILNTEHFDLVLSDILMPKVNGYALIEFVRSNLPGVPVLLMTAYAGSSPPGFNRAGIVMKPINLEELSASIRRLLKGESIGIK